MTSITKLPYFFLIGKGRFNQLHDLLLLQIFEYLYNGTFIISYDKKTRLLTTTINKKCPFITKTLIYKQLHTPYYEYLTVGDKQRLIIKIDPHGKGNITYLIWYDLIKKQMIHQQYDTDSRRKALITRWTTIDRKNKKQHYLNILKTYSTKPTTITRDEFIKNTSFKKPILSRSCIRHNF